LGHIHPELAVATLDGAAVAAAAAALCDWLAVPARSAWQRRGAAITAVAAAAAAVALQGINESRTRA